VAAEFRALGYRATLTTTPDATLGIDGHTLVVDMGEDRDFHYQAAAVEVPVPRIGGRPMPTAEAVDYKAEVLTQTGREGYDLGGLSQQQVITDVLDRYEAHLSFLRYSSEHDYASVITPTVPPPPEAEPTIPVVADDVERVED